MKIKTPEKTFHFGLNLMIPMQINKELIYNESIATIDSLCSFIVQDFISNLPTKLELGKKYILTDQEHNNKICYSLPNKNWQFFQPFTGMVVFIYSQKQLYYFDNNKWNKYCEYGDLFIVGSKIFSYSNDNKNIITISIPSYKSFFYITINQDLEIDLAKVNSKLLTIILECNRKTSKEFNISIKQKVIWSPQYFPSNLQLSNKDVVMLKLYPLSNTNNTFLGEWNIFSIGEEQ